MCGQALKHFFALLDWVYFERSTTNTRQQTNNTHTRRQHGLRTPYFLRATEPIKSRQKWYVQYAGLCVQSRFICSPNITFHTFIKHYSNTHPTDRLLLPAILKQSGYFYMEHTTAFCIIQYTRSSEYKKYTCLWQPVCQIWTFYVISFLSTSDVGKFGLLRTSCCRVRWMHGIQRQTTDGETECNA